MPSEAYKWVVQILGHVRPPLPLIPTINQPSWWEAETNKPEETLKNSSSVALGIVEYLFIAITPKSTLTGSGSRMQPEGPLFNSYYTEV